MQAREVIPRIEPIVWDRFANVVSDEEHRSRVNQEVRHVPETRPFGTDVSVELPTTNEEIEALPEIESTAERRETLSYEDHQAKNSETLHRKFCEDVTIRAHDKLMINKASERPLGASRLTSHCYLDPGTYVSTGMWRPGRPANLINLMAAQPGMHASFDQIREPLRILDGLLLHNLTSESDLKRNVGAFCRELLIAIAPKGAELRAVSEVPLGVYGIAAYSRRGDDLAIGENIPGRTVYSPIDVAYVGNADMVLTFGQGSGELEGESIVGVFEEKIINPREIQDYNRHNDSLCAQVHSSFLGCDARVCIIFANGLVKLFWREVIDGHNHLYCYPAGNDMADRGLPRVQLILIEVMFHVVRCSIRLHPVVCELAPQSAKVRDEPHTEQKRKLPPGSWGSRGKRTDTKTVTVKMVDGSIKKVASFDFKDWSEEEMLLLSKHLTREKKAMRSLEALKPPTGGNSAMSTTDLTLLL